ncbi:hypothetical protein QBC32DRAFT_271684 [Pseudoneurospora amorphoporcata]|uniref:Uncharacterized protein n=1 Tax=Pseudoneurospora amorphoporcata TaxID=241081 RepID=A0AAN6SBK0_9PEZI|nr:hypothetical protein QBC32DRAFT_271684 [Pseudoneurospora amorphoporcata]
MHGSSLLRLPAELHLLIGNTLREDGRLNTLAVIARTSKRLRSIYEPQLYQSPDKTKYQDALLWGANHNSIPIMAQALSCGADLDKQAQYFNSQYVDGMGTHGPVINTRATALQVAVSRGHDEAVRWLLERGAELSDMDNPSNYACPACNRHRILQRYDDQRRALFDSALSTGERRSLLHLAICGAQHVPTLRLLLERGASLEAAARIDGEHAVHAAIRAELPRRERHDPLAPTSRLRHQPPDEEYEDQWPPWYEPLALLKVVLEHIGGTDESAISALNSIGWYQSTPLKTAIYIRDAPIMQQAITLLVRAGASLTRPVPASPHLESMSHFWWILHERGFRAEYVTALLDLGVNVKGERPDDPPPRHPLGGKSPLHFLIRHRRHTKYGPPVVRFQQSLVYLRLPDNGRGHRVGRRAGPARRASASRG